jgi:hypothetical protein
MNNDFFADKVLGIQQPFFFPYLEYFALIAATDHWVVFDTPQYVKLAWVNRNKVLDSPKGTKYITVPVHKHKFNLPTNQVRIFEKQPWNKKIIAQLGTYKKIAPNYHKVINFLKHALNPDFVYLSELNIHTLSETCKYLGISFNFDVYSKMDIKVEKVNGPGDWGLGITKAMGYANYLNAFTGQKFIDKKRYQENGVDVKFLKFNFKPYHQRGNTFEPGLSIIDVMMFNSPEEIREMLNNYQLV